MKIGSSTVDTTYEFGVFDNNFYLIFEVYNYTTSGINFRLDLNQYNSTKILNSIPITSYISTGSGSGFTLFLAIVIPAAVG
ncbi:hypothetical protein LCGC14_1715960, partial [marine sediment metagenome]